MEKGDEGRGLGVKFEGRNLAHITRNFFFLFSSFVFVFLFLFFFNCSSFSLLRNWNDISNNSSISIRRRNRFNRAQCPDWRDDTVIRCILITFIFTHDIHRRALSIKLVDLVRYKVKLSRTTSRFIVITARNDKTSKSNRSYVCTHLDTWLHRSIDVPSDVSVRSILF